MSLTQLSVLHHLRAAEEAPVLTRAGSGTALICQTASAISGVWSTAAPGVLTPVYSHSLPDPYQRYNTVSVTRPCLSKPYVWFLFFLFLFFLVLFIYYHLFCWLFSLSATFDTPQAAKCLVVAEDWRFGGLDLYPWAGVWQVEFSTVNLGESEFKRRFTFFFKLYSQDSYTDLEKHGQHIY